MPDEIVVRFYADTAAFEVAADVVEARLDALLAKAREIQACAPAVSSEVADVLRTIEQMGDVNAD